MILVINYEFLMYPFYHHERPRFFNTATVSNFIFYSLFEGFEDYLIEVSKYCERFIMTVVLLFLADL